MCSQTSEIGHGACQFWIDVGGTFTDCIGVDDEGNWHRRKILSSGMVPGRIDAVSRGRIIHDHLRGSDKPGIWRGYQCHLRDSPGVNRFSAMVIDSAAGWLELDRPLSQSVQGTAYELGSDEEAPLIAIRNLLGLARQTPLPPLHVRLGTTRGTNALLTRQGARTGLVVTEGFADLATIGYQNRPELFRLAIRKREPIHCATVEVAGRIDSLGNVLAPLDEPQVRESLLQLRRNGIESIAICLLHACSNPDHECAIEAIAQQLGFASVSLSHRVAPLRKLVPRIDTTTVDAYLNPLLRNYLQRFEATLVESATPSSPTTHPTVPLRVMTSAGGLVAAEQFSGKDSILSGPAAGVIAYARLAEAAGFSRAIGFDMGGTSTDVSRYDGEFTREYETEKAGVRIVTPMLAIETVAAGGGSICRFDGIKLVVGPESAGARPGPACYGQGGPCTITDVNLLLGRISAEQFAFPLDVDAARKRIEELINEVEQSTQHRYTRDELCLGLIRVANTHMAQAIRSVSLAQGVRPADYVLVAFGGAAPQHACGVAQELQMRHVLIPRDAGILSALGMGLAPVSRLLSRDVHATCDESGRHVWESAWHELSDRARSLVLAEGIPEDQLEMKKSLSMRYQGIDAELCLGEQPHQTYRDEFERIHRQRFGYVYADRSLEVTAVHVEVWGHAAVKLPREKLGNVAHAEPSDRTVSVRFGDDTYVTPVYQRHHLGSGARIAGPAMIVETHSVTLIEPMWRADILSEGSMLLTHEAIAPPTDHGMAKGDPIMLEVFNRNFVAIAEQMGVVLRNTSTSVNVKERLDFSCALFDALGNLVVNAPHVPVHLGAMGETVKHLRASFPNLDPGDVLITNDPYRGGSHLPDVTVVTPVHDRHGQLQFFAASRAHHAEIGGITPGSMPPFSRSLAEEGVLISPQKIMERGEARWELLETQLRSGLFPSRSPQINLADIAAQIAANQQGARDLLQLVDRYGSETVLSYMGDIQRAAAQKTRNALAALPAGVHRFTDALDDGSQICVALERVSQGIRIDFAGTSGVHPGNFNANRAICTAAILYVLRCLIDEDIPLNAGVLDPVELHLPKGLLNPAPGSTAAESPAVVGGNVETSQRIVDVLLGALDLAAASQGTMNNLLFGDDTFGYYETICGGAGATPQLSGAHAVHTHMTNTRLTDPEVLETRYPVRVRQFALRHGSGGKGQFPGGDGVIRELEFLQPLAVSLLTQRRTMAPYGKQGGTAGHCGRNVRIMIDGTQVILPSSASYQAEPGEILRIETPGGGAWGQAPG